ncbi:MAG: xanthine dehydrogenase family protein subunit M [Gammaproteobacteria bacterium]|nr:xanthine dehydrogenase family protein subunit M [Gammaproteobacteria bacterium]
MEAYAYARPTTLDEAVSLLAAHAKEGRRTQLLAGGTDVLVQMRSVDREPRTLVDVKHIADTNRLDISSDPVFIGSAIPSAILNENEELKSLFPGLIEAADLIGSTQIQGRATIGGNLCNSSPAGDTIPAIIAASGVCVIAGSGGTRRVACEDFLTGVGTNVLEADELLVGLEFPRPQGRTADGYLRFIPRTEMDIAVAGAGVALTLDDDGTCTAARVAIGAVAPTALLVPAAADALIGTKVDDEALSAAGAACTAASSPITDKRGTIEYRNKVVAVLCRRAGANARDRALAR